MQANLHRRTITHNPHGVAAGGAGNKACEVGYGEERYRPCTERWQEKVLRVG